MTREPEDSFRPQLHSCTMHRPAAIMTRKAVLRVTVKPRLKRQPLVLSQIATHVQAVIIQTGARPIYNIKMPLENMV